VVTTTLEDVSVVESTIWGISVLETVLDSPIWNISVTESVVGSTVWEVSVTESTVLYPEWNLTTQISSRLGETKTLKLPEGDISGANLVTVELGVYNRWTLFIGTHQQCVLTFGGAVSNGETVTIGSKVYTFQTTLTNVNGNVLIGANQDASLTNLTAAVNLTTGAGTLYAAALSAHPTVKAVADLTANTMTAILEDAGPSTDATTETGANLSWDGAALNTNPDAVNITVELSPDAGTTYYTIPESPITFPDADEDALEFGYDCTHIRLTASSAIHVRAQVRGSF